MVSHIYDIEHLPKIITDIQGIKDVLLAIDPEIVQTRQDLSNLQKELYISTADKYIGLWEQDFSLVFDSSLTLQQRRQRVIEKLSRKQPLTWINLRNLIKRNIGERTQFYISNKASEYKFNILVPREIMPANALKEALDKAKPAYLLYDIIEVDINRRCGTFRCGTNPL